MEHQDDNDEGTWRGLDEAHTRSFVRGLVKDIELHEVESYSRLVRQLVTLRSLVQEEIAGAMRSNLNRKIEYHDKSTPESCRRLAAAVEQDLTQLGLAIRYPAAGPEPVRLRVSKTPPGPSHLWLQLEPLDPSSRQPAFRFPSPFLEKLDLVPAPPRAAGREASPSR